MANRHTKVYTAFGVVLVLGSVMFWSSSSDDQETERESTVASNLFAPISDRASEAETGTSSEFGASPPVSTLLSTDDSQDQQIIRVAPYPGTTIEKPPSLAAAYDELVERATSGEVVAAYSLCHGLSTCKTQGFKTEAELEKAIQGMYQRTPVTSADGKSSITIQLEQGSASNPQPEMLEAEGWLREKFESCTGVSDRQIAGAKGWLRLAADNGSFAALKDLTNVLPPGQEKMDYLAKAWQAGDMFALFAMGESLAEGYGDGGVDVEAAYVNYYLFTQLAESSSLSGNAISPHWHNQAKLEVKRLEAVLFEEQVESARHAANELLSSNEKCCFGPLARLEVMLPQQQR